MLPYSVITMHGEVLGQSNTWTGAERLAEVFRAQGVVCRVSTHADFADQQATAVA